MTIARAHLVDPTVTRWYRRRSAEGGLHHTLCAATVPARGGAERPRKFGSTSRSRNLLGFSRCRLPGSRCWITICTCWCDSTNKRVRSTQIAL